MLTPAGVLAIWFRGLLAIALIAGGILLLRGWYRELPRPVPPESVRTTDRAGDGQNGGAARQNAFRSGSFAQRVAAWRPGLDRKTALFSGGIALLLLSAGGGRLLSPTLFLRSDPEGQPRLAGGQVQKLTRPDGTVLHVETHGPAHGPTVVLSHGWSLTSQEWAYLQRAWGERFRMVVWDMPGLGQSTVPANRDFSLEKLAGDLAAVIQASGDAPVVLIGHSIGGMAIQTFCRLHPEQLGQRIAGIVLVHTTFVNPLRTIWLSGLLTVLQKPLIEPLLYLQIGLSPLVRVSNWLAYWNGSIHYSTALTGFGGRESREQLDFIARFQPQASPAVLARGALAMLKLDERETLPRIPVPVLIIAGEHDPVTLPQASEELSRGIPRSRLQTLPRTKHFGLIEYNREFSEAAAEFCSQTLKPAPAASQG